MPTLSAKQVSFTLALAALALLFAFQETVSAARLAGGARPVSTTSAEPVQEGAVLQKAADADGTPAPAPKKKAPAKKKTAQKPTPKKAAASPAWKTVSNDTADNGAGKAPPAKPGPANGKLGKHVTIDFDNVDILAFIKFMSELTGKNFVVDETVKGKVSVFSPQKISTEEAYKVFESVLEIHGLTTVPAGDVIKIVPSQQAKEKSVATRLRAEGIGPNDRVITQIVPLRYASPTT